MYEFGIKLESIISTHDYAKRKKYHNKKNQTNSQFNKLIYKAQLTILIKEELNVYFLAVFNKY